jgi:TPR repeat protein
LRANYWYQKSANQGDENAQDALGYAYQFGRGVSRNDATANQWYLKSANQGDPDSQIALGINYSMGRGVPVDPVESYKWFYLAARNVDSSTGEVTFAKTQLQVAALTAALTPAQIALAEREAMQWLKAHHTR